MHFQRGEASSSSFPREDAGRGIDGGQSQAFFGFFRTGQRDNLRPCRIERPVACRANRLIVNLRVCAVQQLKCLFVETANPPHGEDSGQPPLLVAAGIGGPDRIRVPGLRATDSAPHRFGKIRIRVRAKHLLDLVEGVLGDRDFFGLIEFAPAAISRTGPREMAA